MSSNFRLGECGACLRHATATYIRTQRGTPRASHRLLRGATKLLNLLAGCCIVSVFHARILEQEECLKSAIICTASSSQPPTSHFERTLTRSILRAGSFFFFFSVVSQRILSNVLSFVVLHPSQRYALMLPPQQHSSTSTHTHTHFHRCMVLSLRDDKKHRRSTTKAAHAMPWPKYYKLDDLQ